MAASNAAVKPGAKPAAAAAPQAPKKLRPWLLICLVMPVALLLLRLQFGRRARLAFERLRLNVPVSSWRSVLPLSLQHPHLMAIHHQLLLLELLQRRLCGLTPRM